SSPNERPLQTSLRALLITASSSRVKADGVGGVCFFVSAMASSFQIFVVFQARARPKTGSVVPGAWIVNHDRVGLAVVECLALVLQPTMVRRVGEDLADQFPEIARALHFGKQLLLDDVLFIGVPGGDGLGDLLLRGARLLELGFLLLVAAQARRRRNKRRERASGSEQDRNEARRGGHNRSPSHGVGSCRWSPGYSGRGRNHRPKPAHVPSDWLIGLSLQRICRSA